MHPAISDFPSLHFYDGQVTSGTRASDRPTPRGFPWPTKAAPVAFVSVADGAHAEGGDGFSISRGRSQLESRGGTEAAVQGGSAASTALGTSYCNRREAEAVAFALELLVAGGDVKVCETTRVQGTGGGRREEIMKGRISVVVNLKWNGRKDDSTG